MKGLFLMVLALAASCAQAQQPRFTAGHNEWNADSLGNIRAVVEVAGSGRLAKAVINWRRPDEHPELKRIIVQDGQTSKLVEGSLIGAITNESGEVFFQPVSGKGTYYIYYMPYKNEGRSNYPKGVYLSPARGAGLAAAGGAGAGSGGAGAGSGAAADVVASVREIESIDSFNTFYPMEVIATSKETRALLATVSRKDYLVFPEDRLYPVKMKTRLPQHWATRPYRLAFTGEASRGENYSYQLGVYALSSLSRVRVVFSDLHGPQGAILSKEKMSCLNNSGIDYTGKPFIKTVDVAAGEIQPLWCLLDIPAAVPAGLYTGTVTIQADGAAPSTVAIRLHIKEEVLADGGISHPEEQTRLHWLNSTLMQDNTVIAPYTPLKVTGQTIGLLGRQLLIGGDGLPAQIQTFFTPEMTGYTPTPNDLLSGPIHFTIIDGRRQQMVLQNSGVVFTKQEAGTVEWTATSSNSSVNMQVMARLEFDGFLSYRVKVTTLQDIDLDDISMIIPFRKSMAKYMMGLGLKGGICPDNFDWKWQVATKNQDGAWIGTVNAGLQYSLRDEKYTRPLNTNFYLQKPLLLPSSWGNGDSGGNGVKGGIRLVTADNTVSVQNFSGSRSMHAGDTLYYNVTFLITPFHPLNTDFQWATRFYHRYNAIDSIRAMGATVVNIHHATPINPWINYPFIEWRAMKQYIDEAHSKGLKVKIYNTVRELSDRAYELFPMRSLGHEIYSPGKGGGFSWLQEHVKEDYIPAWFVPELKDAALINSGMSRWHNYYVEGMNWLVQNVGIDGIYLDDVAFDRVTMKRIKRVLTQGGAGDPGGAGSQSGAGGMVSHPGIIDLHSANQYNKNDGFNNSANLYMEHFPYLNRLWFGEYFDYEKNDPAFFLTEVSGIPFGLMGEMLQNGGNAWRGMVYGMTNRMPWSENADPRPIWKIWDEFGMAGSEMIGYWSGHCPVTTSDSLVLATVYLRKGSALVAIGSWAAGDTTIHLNIDWKQLGIDPARAVITAPAIANFQPAAVFVPGSAIPVPKNKGWILLINEK